MHFAYKAYLFESPLALGAIKEKLNALGPWQWTDKGSDRFGDYLSAYVAPDSMLKLYEESKGHYQMDVKFRSNGTDAQTEAEAMHDRVTAVLLPGISAKGVHPGDVED